MSKQHGEPARLETGRPVVLQSCFCFVGAFVIGVVVTLLLQSPGPRATYHSAHNDSGLQHSFALSMS